MHMHSLLQELALIVNSSNSDIVNSHINLGILSANGTFNGDIVINNYNDLATMESLLNHITAVTGDAIPGVLLHTQIHSLVYSCSYELDNICCSSELVTAPVCGGDCCGRGAGGCMFVGLHVFARLYVTTVCVCGHFIIGSYIQYAVSLSRAHTHLLTYLWIHTFTSSHITLLK